MHRFGRESGVFMATLRLKYRRKQKHRVIQAPGPERRGSNRLETRSERTREVDTALFRTRRSLFLLRTESKYVNGDLRIGARTFPGGRKRQKSVRTFKKNRSTKSQSSRLDERVRHSDVSGRNGHVKFEKVSLKIFPIGPGRPL